MTQAVKNADVAIVLLRRQILPRSNADLLALTQPAEVALRKESKGAQNTPLARRVTAKEAPATRAAFPAFAASDAPLS